MAAGASICPDRSGPQRVECPVAGVEAEAAVHRLPGADRLDARDDVCGGGHQGREVRDHEDDEADQGDRPQDREDGSSSGRGRGRPVGPRRRREAAAWTEVSSKQGATARARPSYRRGGPVRRGRRGGHCRCAAPRTETTLENRAATDALHPFAHEGPALFNAAVRGHTKAVETRNPSARIYIDSVGCAALRPARWRLRERGGMTGWSTRREASGTAMCGSRRFGRRRSISGETIFSKSRGNEGPPPKGRRSSSPCPETTIFRTRRSASSDLSRSPTIRTSARSSRGQDPLALVDAGGCSALREIRPRPLSRIGSIRVSPSARALGGSIMGPSLKRGLGYLALDPEETAVSFVRVLAEARTPYLWITSRRLSAPPEGGDLLRVTTLSGAMGTADPRRLQDLRTAATTFFDERGPGALVVDCLDRLVAHSGVERVLRFVDDLHEETATRNAILIVFADPRGTNPRMIAWLERELDPFPRTAIAARAEQRVVA